MVGDSLMSSLVWAVAYLILFLVVGVAGWFGTMYLCSTVQRLIGGMP